MQKASIFRGLGFGLWLQVWAPSMGSYPAAPCRPTLYLYVYVHSINPEPQTSLNSVSIIQTWDPHRGLMMRTFDLGLRGLDVTDASQSLKLRN